MAVLDMVDHAGAALGSGLTGRAKRSAGSGPLWHRQLRGWAAEGGIEQKRFALQFVHYNELSAEPTAYQWVLRKIVHCNN
jgi:hypothetical protein